MDNANIRHTEQKLVDAILCGENISANMEKLFFSLRPLFRNIIIGYGQHGEDEDLMQEMYIALAAAIDQYTDPEIRNKYPFSAIIATQARNSAFMYYRKLYGSFTDKEGKTKIREKAQSLNSKATDEEWASEVVDLLEDNATVESAVIENETAEERRLAAAVLWGEVDRLCPTHKSAIIDRFVNEISRSQMAKAEDGKMQAISSRVHNALQNLRKNQKVHDIAHHFLPSVAYRGGFGFFKSTSMSSTEYVAMKNLERQERRKTTYQLIDPAFFGEKNNRAIERYTGVSNEVIRRLRNRISGVSWDSAQKIARLYNLPLDNVFEECIKVKHAIPKLTKKYGKRITFRLVQADYLDRHKGLDGISHDKMEELGLTPEVLRVRIHRLKHGRSVQMENAQQLAYLFGEPFEKMFVEALS